MISLQNISKQYGGRYLFRDISLHIGDGDRLALVGSNGAGKSTLMKIITGDEETDSGTITRSKLNTTGYLPQDSIYHRGRTLYEETERVFQDIIDLQARIETIGEEIAATEDGDGAGRDSQRLSKLMQDLDDAQHLIEHKRGYMTDTKIKQVLFGLGFVSDDLQRMTEEFSGGWQMRMATAKLLLREPSVLLLDEPTNHLDIESLEWLEQYLQSYRGSIVLVSHDSRFLDNIVDRIVEISRGTVTEYTGNYASYVRQKAQHSAIVQSTYANQQKLIRKTTRFIERFRYKNTKATQVQSRVKMLEKLERVDIEEEEREISFHFPEPPRGGRMAMELEGISKAYGSKTIFSDISLHIERGDKIALLGVNGSGKSTLARIIAGIEPFQQGSRKPGHNVVISYYSQNRADELDDDRTVLNTLDIVAPAEAPERLRTLLGCFLFTDDDVFKPVKVLSGGEKSRLALARMLLQPANLLILDEPTNHLDLQSKAILQESIAAYSGSCIIIAHDRDFLDPITDKVFFLQRGHLETYPGTVDEFLERDRSRGDTVKGESAEGNEPSHQSPMRAKKRREAELRQALYRRTRPLLQARERVEADIARTEEAKAEHEAAFADQTTYEDEGAVQRINMAYADISARLEQLYDQWEAIEEEIEEIRQSLGDEPSR